MKIKGRKVLHVGIALAVALVIWMVVDYDRSESVSNRPTKVVENVPVEFVGESTTLASRGLMRIADEDPPTVTLELRGKRLDLAKLDTKAIKAVVNLGNVTDVGPQSLTYTVDYQNGDAQKVISVIDQEPAAISVNIGNLFRKSVDIKVDVTGTVEDSFIAGEPQFEPQTVELWGKQSEVMLVETARVTLNISNANATVVELLEYQLYDYKGQVIDNPNIHSNTDKVQVTLPVEMQKELTLKVPFEEVPGIRQEDVNCIIKPATVLVTGDAGILGAADSILLPTISLGELNGDRTFSFPVKPPQGCEIIDGTTEAVVTIQFKDLASRQVTTNNLQYENAPAGKTITILSSDLTVTLRGKESVVNGILPDDITVLADLSQVENASGNYTVPAVISVVNGVDVGVVGTYQLKVSISEAAVDEPAEEEAQ